MAKFTPAPEIPTQQMVPQEVPKKEFQSLQTMIKEEPKEYKPASSHSQLPMRLQDDIAPLDHYNRLLSKLIKLVRAK